MKLEAGMIKFDEWTESMVEHSAKRDKLVTAQQLFGFPQYFENSVSEQIHEI